MQGALITSKDNRLFLETYLIDTTVTKKGKKVNDKTIDENIANSRGHPLTLYPKQTDKNWIWDHPVIETNSLGDNIELQKKYTIGHEIKVKKVKDGYWNAVYEITDDGAKRLFSEYSGKTIPFYTSTGIIHSANEDPLDIRDWRIIHNAIVSEPANGFEKAGVVDMCQGTEQTCQSILTTTASASAQVPFCTKAALSNYISSLALSASSFPHYTMSSETSSAQVSAEKSGAIQYNQGFSPTNAQTGVGTVPASLTPPSPPEQFANKENQEQSKKEDVDYKSLADQLKTELKQLKTEKESKEAENKTVTERLASLERENSRNNRKNQVYSILQQFPEAFTDPKTGSINQQEYSKTVLEWIDKGYDDKTIQELLEAKVIKVKSLQQKTDNLKQVYSSMTTPDYQTTEMTTASVGSVEDSSLPIWEKVFDLTNANIRNAAEKYQRGGNY